VKFLIHKNILSQLRKIFVLVFIILYAFTSFSQNLYIVSKSTVKFTSDAPLEVIEANSEEMKGLLNISDGSFAFRIAMNSFQGFISELQEAHFNENYVESDKYPTASFSGKIIEKTNFSSPGLYKVKGTGKFFCHGVEKDKTIAVTLTFEKDKIKVNGEFSILLEDYRIKRPAVVYKKIAKEIFIEINAELIPK